MTATREPSEHATLLKGVGNYYAEGIHIEKFAGAFWWCIEDVSGWKWQQIPEHLYRALMAFAEEQQSGD